jgi:hypothetical protein
MGFSTALMAMNGPSRFTDMILRQWSRSTSSQATKGTIAALLTSTSTRPNRSTVASTIACTSSGCETSARTPSPSPERPAAAALAPSSLMSAIATAAPSSESFSAIALPMPCAPPVTRATRSFSFMRSS